MPIVLNNNKLSGVFPGQSEPIEFGNQVGVIGPNYIGLYSGDDSATINAYFDPSISQVVRVVLEKMGGTIFEIAYVQVGQFFINGTPLPFRVHQKSASYPFTKDLHDPNRHPYSWVDICWYDGNDGIQQSPYYPNWHLQDEPGYSDNLLFKYPQDFGSKTKFPFLNPEPDDCLCAFMSSEIDLGNNSIAGGSVMKELAKTPSQQFNYLNTNIPLALWNTLDLRTLINQITTINNRVAPPIAAISNPVKIDSQDGSRRYIEYTSEVRIRQQSVTSRQTLMLFDSPQYPGTIACAQISEFLEHLNQEVNEGKIDFEELQKVIKLETDRDVAAESRSKKLRTSMKLDVNAITIAYRFIVYPCTIVVQNNIRFIVMYEGFTWRVGRTYSSDNGWENHITTEIKQCEEYEKWIFKDELDKYYKLVTLDLNIPIQFPL